MEVLRRRQKVQRKTLRQILTELRGQGINSFVVASKF